MADKRMSKFKEEFEKRPTYALEWRALGLFNSEYLREWAEHFNALAQNPDDSRLEMMLRHWMKSLVHELVRSPARCASTSLMANGKELEEAQARSEMVREIGQLLNDYTYL